MRYGFNLLCGNLQNIYKNTHTCNKKIDTDTLLRKPPKDIGKTEEIIKITFTNESSKIVNMIFQTAKCLNNLFAEVLVKDRLCCHTGD